MPDATLDAYGDALRTLVHDEGLAARLGGFDLRAAYGDLSYDEKRARVEAEHAPTLQDVVGRDAGRRGGPAAVPGDHPVGRAPHPVPGMSAGRPGNRPDAAQGPAPLPWGP
ncbi:hypothetical protein [Streptomyces sp. x-19]|uniref:hypothetical protein n=1 Tax=Streptomyces sp. x-19 TaxID=2789280 RepID=UPI003981497F